MANFYPGFWSDLRAAIVAVWPEIGANFRAVQAEHIDWKVLIADGELVPPYVVVRTQFEEDQDWGLGNYAERATVEVFYIENPSSQDASGDIEAKLYALKNYMLTTAFTNLEVLEGSEGSNVAETNAAQLAFLESDMPFAAGSVGFECLVGETLH